MSKKSNKIINDQINPRSVVPIPSTIEPVKGYPSKLILFRVPASPFYWVRYYDGKPIKRSTRTTNKAEALRFAKTFYEELLINKRLGIGIKKLNPSFLQCIEAVIQEDELKGERGELSTSYVASQKKVFRGHISEFFKTTDIIHVDYECLNNFKTYLIDKGLTSGSIKINFSSVKKVLNYAQRMKFITHCPLFPKLKREDNARGYFTLAEYRLLHKTAKRLLGTTFEITQTITSDNDALKVKKLRNVVITKELMYLMGFMVYTFIRPTDIKTIQLKHIHLKREQSDTRDYEYLWMPIPETKKHSKALVSMPKAAYYYKKLLALRQENGDTLKSDDFLFMPNHKNRAYAYRALTRQFDAVIATSNLKTSSDGDIRTLYSLRHTSLMYRLKYGSEISPIKLANNARTSVEMLTRFYLPQLENIDIKYDLHAKKKR